MPKNPTYINEKDIIPEQPKPLIQQAPDNLDKINSMMDKGLGILDKILSLKKYRESENPKVDVNAEIENKAHKEATMMFEEQKRELMANLPQPVIVTKEPVIEFKVIEAQNFLIDLLESLKSSYGNKTLSQLIDGDIKKLKSSGMLGSILEEFLKKHIEVKK